MKSDVTREKKTKEKIRRAASSMMDLKESKYSWERRWNEKGQDSMHVRSFSKVKLRDSLAQPSNQHFMSRSID